MSFSNRIDRAEGGGSKKVSLENYRQMCSGVVLKRSGLKVLYLVLLNISFIIYFRKLIFWNSYID